MTEGHDVQALSDVDIHVYEAVAAQTVETGGAELDALVRASGLSEAEVRQSLATLIEQGYVVPKGGGYGLGPHTFEVEYD
ncbi:helix-turn-helix domain-containing protein [Nonomuraea sp. NN258]|uniref:helix-turn-helix domain-containing protein n=1 Tax=Nonomuraea antri TaxID=2730852 RepID=UPI00156807A8|nr:helix-turn-helix domain-containing protein [Nonomuraea antri]NRQ40392.1 helix-turn-helix domain-containing protein [Nonomuraea antri]